jgi:hypothetical protein
MLISPAAITPLGGLLGATVGLASPFYVAAGLILLGSVLSKTYLKQSYNQVSPQMSAPVEEASSNPAISKGSGGIDEELHISEVKRLDHVDNNDDDVVKVDGVCIEYFVDDLDFIENGSKQRKHSTLTATDNNERNTPTTFFVDDRTSSEDSDNDVSISENDVSSRQACELSTDHLMIDVQEIPRPPMHLEAPSAVILNCESISNDGAKELVKREIFSNPWTDVNMIILAVGSFFVMVPVVSFHFLMFIHLRKLNNFEPLFHHNENVTNQQIGLATGVIGLPYAMGFMFGLLYIYSMARKMMGEVTSSIIFGFVNMVAVSAIGWTDTFYGLIICMVAFGIFLGILTAFLTNISNPYIQQFYPQRVVCSKGIIIIVKSD